MTGTDKSLPVEIGAAGPAVPPYLSAGSEVLPLVGGVQTALDMEIPDHCYLEHEPAPSYTAARFRSRRPDDYHECARLIGLGVAVEEIKRLLKVHHETVRAVATVEKLAIGEVRDRTIRGLKAAVGLWGDNAAEQLSKLKGLPFFIGGGIVVDKLAQLQGEPTQRIEVRHTDGGVKWAEVKAKLEALEVETVVEAGTDFEQKGTKGTKAEPNEP